MARTPNLHNQDPSASIGASLGRALFGDPAAAQAQRESIAQAELSAARVRQADAAAGYDTSRTSGQNYQNTSATSLPEMIAALMNPQPAAPVEMPSAPLVALPGATPGPDPRAALGSIIAAIAGQQGDKVDMSETIGALGAYAGGEETARRGLVAQGQTPGKEFALTSDRADEIAGMENASELAKAIGVASTNNRDDVPIANLQAATTRRGQDIGSSDKRRGQDVSAAARREAAAMREARRSAQSANWLSAGAYRILFGVADDPDEPGELRRQIDERGWDPTPDAGTLTRIRSAVIDRYRKSGNHTQAVRDALDDVKRRWDRKQAGMGR